MIKDLIRVKDKVEYLLMKFPETRDSDKILWLWYLREFEDMNNQLAFAYDPWRHLSETIRHPDTPTMESLRRVRQKFQQEGQYFYNFHKFTFHDTYLHQDH